VDLLRSERMARFPDKTDLQLLTARRSFRDNSAALLQGNDTPIKLSFVRWQFPQIPTSVDMASWRLRGRWKHRQRTFSFHG